MKRFVGSLALIRRPEIWPSQWLVRRSPRRNEYRLISAVPLEGESYRECLDREIGWALNLRRAKDYIVSSAPRIHFERPLAVPGDDEATFFIVQFFEVNLFGKQAAPCIEADVDNRWASAAELREGVCGDGLRIDQRDRLLLAKSDVIPVDESW